LLGAFTLFWVAGFDIIYATQDVEFDRKAGLFSIPSRLGVNRALAVSGWLHVAAFLALALLVWWQLRTPVAALFLAATGVLLLLEHRQGQNIETAFFRINAALGFVVLALVVAGT
ncbi:MAG TPA: UbiA family prenyltransferase, partial [Candidatus Eisenbacteria bacterium]